MSNSIAKYLYSPIPELVLGVLDQERLQRIANLVAHVRIGEIETGQNRSLQLRLFCLFSGDQLTDQHIHKHYVGRIDEGDVLEGEGRMEKERFPLELLSNDAI